MVETTILNTETTQKGPAEFLWSIVDESEPEPDTASGRESVSEMGIESGTVPKTGR